MLHYELILLEEWKIELSWLLIIDYWPMWSKKYWSIVSWSVKDVTKYINNLFGNICGANVFWALMTKGNQPQIPIISELIHH